MPQLSLYLDNASMDILRNAAAGAGVSMSKYTSNLIHNSAQYGGWPQGYWEFVYGCLDEGFDVDDADLDGSLDDSCDWFE